MDGCNSEYMECALQVILCSTKPLMPLITDALANNVFSSAASIFLCTQVQHQVNVSQAVKSDFLLACSCIQIL